MSGIGQAVPATSDLPLKQQTHQSAAAGEKWEIGHRY